ncbi:helix-turn-helix protein [Arcticibacter pallidicorallinus]|uniref:Helix-turn-helix protein n=1 Tax=Arcticibacter pallidicorallinus TaxID=1259464 RepID=A0A2T0U5M3_9SPHI|nr:helix-turn-helix transcriptional regulator [Arcticibacter pallidicorallinus]PRY53148.1 helix-turn-helix protein [Arcticibacter pallidicorallinus]
MTEIYIKNMVCPRCISAVRQIIEEQGLLIESVVLGHARIGSVVDNVKIADIARALQSQGFELIDSGQNRLVEGIKTLIIDTIFHQADAVRRWNWSAMIADSLSHDYNYLSTLFSATEGITIEKYIIRQKAERVKELLCYNELSLKEIAYTLGYSSAAHLSTQFKRVTSYTPGQFKAMQHKRDNRIPLDAI